MIYLSKKRILIISILLILAVIGGITNLIKKEEIQETVALPVSSKTIVIDAGHGVPDEGDCLLTLMDNN